MICTQLDLSSFYSTIFKFFIFLIAVIILEIMIVIFITYNNGTKYVRFIEEFSKTLTNTKKGDFSPSFFSECEIKELLDLEQLSIDMNTQIKELFINNNEMQQKNYLAERKALEAQINPHFLYNTLNCIHSLAHMHKEKQIEDISAKLGHVMRYVISNDDSISTVEQEYKFVLDYLDIQKVRFGDKLKITTYCDESIKYVRMPKLMFQPLIENAIVHGLEPKIGEWNITFGIYDKNEDTIEAIIQDNGVGFDPKKFDNIENLEHTNHIGVYNIYRRLKLCYKDKGRIKIHSQQGVGSEFVLIFSKKL